MNGRVEALAGQLKLPLLVTNLVNVRYLTGFDSSNAALLVRPKGDATLYTDFRYIEAAQEVEGVEVVLVQRSLIQNLAGMLSGRIQFEADVLPYLQWERLGSGRVTPVASSGIVDGLRAVKDAQELAAIARAAGHRWAPRRRSRRSSPRRRRARARARAAARRAPSRSCRSRSRQ